MKSIYFIIFFGLSLNCFAQLEVYNTGIIHIGNAADIFSASGNFTNTSSATLTNNGNLYIRGNISNAQASMSAGTGTLFLNGTSAQSINGSQPFKTNHFNSNNATGITLNNNLSVAGLHTFTAGLITTSATPNFMMYEAGASYTGLADSRHVNGWVKKIGNTDFAFPVGNGTYFRTVSLTSLTANSEFNVRHNGAITPNRLNVFNPLVYIDTSEYWTINKISGAAARVFMNWDNSKVPFPSLMMTDIRVAHYDGSFWRNIGGAASGNQSTTGSLTSNSVSVFNNNFTFGSVSYVLPLKLISFTAGRITDYTKTNWTIGNELNVKQYELQRSDEGINFYTLSVQTANNQNRTEFYSYDDKKTLKGTAYYRLKIIDVFNEIKFSQTIAVSAASSKGMYVITNPVDASIDLFADDAYKGTYQYTIVNSAGQQYQSGVLNIVNAGIQRIGLQSTFSPGAYILTLKNATHSLQKMILKK